ncbi:MAG: hydantoinase/oxoprolinase family protein, partial [Planctomycetaceae bacterium]
MISAGHLLHDVSRADDPAGFWQGAKVRFLTADGETLAESRVTDSLPVVRDADDRNRMGRLICETVPAGVSTGTLYELDTGEEAPVLAVRKVLGLTVDAAFPAITVKLGTTRGTNALLTRCGARTAFVTTRGFADVLRIANQDRPGLFDLAIRKSDPLFESVLEVDERIDAQGHVLKSPDPEAVRRGLCELRAAGIESIAICLLHAFADGRHERIVERIARAAGFREVSISSQLAPLIRIVSRGDTTVLDAYLNPVLRDYVERIQMRLGPQSRLRMMTSAGGLVAADSFSGRDSLLSGPAGGVIGFSRIAAQAGFQKSIGFDMGGTSTDVSRFDGRYELEYETLKAGVRIAAPMLAIETVAAGGGSVCGFDGVKLFVGPQSAGADPGPACYGRGGPLTLTDVNLFLGRILPEEFPFPLDSTVVEGLLAAMCSEIAAAPLGGDCTVIELAEGFLQIANASMVRAIRHISVAKGYDPADYALVTFGGAGAQHACALARQLRIRNVLVHPLAGILSAYGIGLADIRRFAERTVLQPLSRHTLEQLKSDWEQLEAGVLAEVRSEGVPDNRVDSPVRSLDLRYEGVESTINITQPDDGDYRTAYEIQHQQLYG